MIKNTTEIFTKGKIRLRFSLILCVILVFYFNYAITLVNATSPDGNLLEENREQRKLTLERLAQKPLTASQQHLLSQLIDKEDNLDQILSTTFYLSYLKEKFKLEYNDYSAFVNASPTLEQQSAVLSLLKSVLNPIMTDLSALPPTPDAAKLQICVNLYFRVRKWLPQGMGIIDDTGGFTDEFKQLFVKHYIRPMMEIYKEIFGIGKEWGDSYASAFSKLGQLGKATSLMAENDTKVFRDAWHDQIKEYGSREGLLRCAIAFPAEFALMRSFFEDFPALEEWILTPFIPLKTKKEATEKGQ